MLGLILGFLVITTVSTRHMTLTYDEDHHYQEGEKILSLDASRANPSAMPVSALNALPEAIAAHLPDGSVKSILSRFPSAARLATILAGAALGYLCFRWSFEMNGYLPALLTLGLYVLEPNIIAHSRLITTDIYAAATSLLAIYALWRHIAVPGLLNGLVFGLALGLAQVSKFTGVLLYPICVVIHLAVMSPSWMDGIRKRDFRSLRIALARFAAEWLGFIAVSLFVINAGFLFSRTLMPLSNYRFQSQAFKALQSLGPPISRLPFPLPESYLVGLDEVLWSERTAMGGVSGFYLLGQYSNTGFIGYFLIASFYKVPLAIQGIFWLALGRYIARSARATFMKKEIYLAVPFLVYTVYFNLFYRYPIGIRHYLVAFPFILIFCSTLITGWGVQDRWKWVALAAACGYLVVSVVGSFPHYIAYFNELVPDRRFAYKILADSNLDWGQNGWYLQRYKTDNPDVHVSPERPVPGTVVVGVNEFLGIIGTRERYAWLRDHYQPVDAIAYSYLVFEVPRVDLRGRW